MGFGWRFQRAECAVRGRQPLASPTSAVAASLLAATSVGVVLGLRVVQEGQTGPRVAVLAALLRSTFFIISAWRGCGSVVVALLQGQRVFRHGRLDAVGLDPPLHLGAHGRQRPDPDLQP